jgi:glycosyltransferase involved in cell wall biosynthesis
VVLYNSCRTNDRASVSEDEFLRHFDAPPDGFRVLFQGSMTEDRNLDNLVKAFSLLDGSIRLFMLGGGAVEGRLRSIAERMHSGSVHFGGWVSQERLLGFTAHAHMGVIPYDGSRLLNNLHATPNKLFEFIESSLPVCSAEMPEVTAIIEGGGIGRSYRMTSPEETANAIDDCRRRVAEGEFTLPAHLRAREAYGWERQSRVLLDLYRKLGGNACAE